MTNRKKEIENEEKSTGLENSVGRSLPDKSGEGPQAGAPDPNDHRSFPRASGKIKAVVQFKPTSSDLWKEMVEMTSASKNGATVILSKEVPVGRLLSMAIQMPAELRLYDAEKEVYATLGLVQYCSATTAGDGKAYHVGVAFVGKKMPDSYKEDPTQCYRITGQASDGLWTITESGRAFKNRRSTRFWRQFEVSVSIRDNVQKTTKKQAAMTRDISAGGMSVWGPLDVKVGDRIKVASAPHDFFGIALVRNVSESDDPERPLIHLEFEGMEFPIGRLRRTRREKK